MATKYRVEKGTDFSDTKVFKVFEPPNERGYECHADVWLSPNGKCRCCGCSSILVAMSTACRHVKAVKRFIKRTTA